MLPENVEKSAQMECLLTTPLVSVKIVTLTVNSVEELVNVIV